MPSVPARATASAPKTPKPRPVPDPQQQAIVAALKGLTPQARAYAMHRLEWARTALPHQIEPLGDWSVWLLLAGRGAGKTRTAAETVFEWGMQAMRQRILISAPTAGDLRDVCFEGESGLLAVIPQILVRDYNKSMHELWLVNGTLFKGIAGQEPNRFRGPQFHAAWFDELAAFDYIDDAWNTAALSIRLGERTRTIVTTTPRPKDLLKRLMARDDVTVTRASTYANLANLAVSFQREVLQHEGTRLGRQEIHAEMIDPEESGIVKRPWFKLHPRHLPIPPLSYVVQSYDCATSDKTVNDPTACVVLGVFKPGVDQASPDAPWSVLVLDCWSEYLQYPELRARVMADAKALYGTDPENDKAPGRPVDLILVEAKSAGISLIQDLERGGLYVRGYNPGRADKTQRLNIVAPVIAAGRVWVPESMARPGHPRDWADQMISQMCSFPEATHDDLVDAMSQALRLLRDMTFLSIDPPRPEVDLYPDDVPKRVNPYAS